MASTHINSDTMALIQRGIYQQPGFYGSQELKNSNDDFNSAVNMGAQLAGFASVLKTTVAPTNYKRTRTNYILTAQEKQAITFKSRELALYGVVPVDVLENFFYILAANDSESDLIHIANVIGIPNLGQPRYIRNIRDIVDIPDIYKVGYLANGVSSITHKYASRYNNISTYDNYSQSSYGTVLSQANYSTSLGIIGPVLLSTAHGYNGIGDAGLMNAPSLSTSAIGSAFNVVSGFAGGPTSLPPTTISALLNPAATIQNQATLIGAQAINSLIGNSPLGGILSSFGPLGGIVASMLLQQIGGNSMGSFMSEMIMGQRIATSTLANNPMLTAPSYAGKSFFGEAPVSLPAVDQVFCRRVGAFGTTTGGSGTVSFGMQNFASMGGSLSIASVVSMLSTGSSMIPSPTTFFGKQMQTMTTNVCSNLNVPTTSLIEMRRSDNAIPFKMALSAAMVGENFSPFGSDPFSSGWKLASSSANDIQKYNPRYIETCRTSL